MLYYKYLRVCKLRYFKKYQFIFYFNKIVDETCDKDVSSTVDKKIEIL